MSTHRTLLLPSTQRICHQDGVLIWILAFCFVVLLQIQPSAVKIDKLNSISLGAYQKASDGLHTRFLQYVLEHHESVYRQHEFLAFPLLSLPPQQLFIRDLDGNWNRMFVVRWYGIPADPLASLAVNLNECAVERQRKPSRINNVEFNVPRLVLAIEG